MLTFYVPSTMPSGEEYKTTFQFHFDVADHFGIKAVKDIFKKAFEDWKSDIEYITELCIVMNTRCWFWHKEGNTELSELYAEFFYQVKNYVYSKKSKFTEEDRSYFFEMTD